GVHGVKAGEFDASSVEAGGKKRDLAVTGETPAAQKLASAKTPDKPDETAKNWHDKLFRVFPSEVLGKGEKPANGEPQVALKVTYGSKGKQKGFIEVGKVTLPAPATPPAAPPPPGTPANP